MLRSFRSTKGLINKDRVIFSNRIVLNEFPFYKTSFVDDYLSLLEKELDKSYNVIKETFNRISLKEEIFECEVGDGNWYIKYLFDINKAKRLLRENNFSVQNIDTKILAEYSKIIETDDSYISKTSSKDPVIVCYYPHSHPSFFVIDGNHRVMRNYRNNLKETSAYLVPKELMLDFFIAPVFKYLVYVHNNVSMIGAYMLGDISKKDLLLNIQPIINFKYLDSTLIFIM